MWGFTFSSFIYQSGCALCTPKSVQPCPNTAQFTHFSFCFQLFSSCSIFMLFIEESFAMTHKHRYFGVIMFWICMPTGVVALLNPAICYYGLNMSYSLSWASNSKFCPTQKGYQNIYLDYRLTTHQNAYLCSLKLLIDSFRTISTSLQQFGLDGIVVPKLVNLH